MKLVKLIVLVLILHTALLAEFELPTVHSAIMLDAKFYGGGDSNSGFYDTTNRYQVRKAALEFEGKVKELEYSLEFGISTCTGSGVSLKLMDASLMYKWNDNFAFGLKQGHVLRGFAGSTECRERLTMEKPVFMTTFATCHPTGFVAEYYQEIGDISSLEAEVAIMNGPNGTLDGEHDYNLGAVFYTPLEGFALTAVYNHTAANYYDPVTYQPYSEDGYRSIFGVDYQNYNLSATAEYFMGKGFSTDDTEMIAYYAQAGYAIPINLGRIKYIQPVLLYEFWDKNSGEDTDNQYTYVNAGFNISLNEYTKLKFNYKIPQNEPEASAEQESSLIARLQIGF